MDKYFISDTGIFKIRNLYSPNETGTDTSSANIMISDTRTHVNKENDDTNKGPEAM